MKKAKYTGGLDGVRIDWFDDDGNQHVIEVEQGHELPAELEDGTPVPARVRDDLLSRDDWSEVKRATGDKAKGE